MIVVDVTPPVARLVALGLRLCRQRVAGRPGLARPADLDEVAKLEVAFAKRADEPTRRDHRRQQPPLLDLLAEAVEYEAAMMGLSEAARRLGVSRRTVDRLVADGHLNVVRVGRAVRVPVPELDRFISNGGTDAA